ncbi:hypothetical protein DVS77_25375 [Mycolicibacterium moriokaense]|nr:hypothetical protein DVS77_25375 [Mycolicibacterium moriokaense]
MALALAGCNPGHRAGAEPVEFAVGQEFSLRGGQEATITGEDLRLRFTDVLEDSRCPTQVECFWTGQARIAVQVEPTGAVPTTVEFNTNPAPGQKVLTADVADHTVSLKSLDPYPRTPDDAIAFQDYRATLVVVR